MGLLGMVPHEDTFKQSFLCRVVPIVDPSARSQPIRAFGTYFFILIWDGHMTWLARVRWGSKVQQSAGWAE